MTLATYRKARAVGYSTWGALRFAVLHARLASYDPPQNLWGRPLQ